MRASTFFAALGLLAMASMLRDDAVAAASASREIRYRAPGAGAVFVVWGVDGWQTVAPELWPDGTRIDDGEMRSPLRRDGDEFAVTLRTDAGAVIDYVFHVTALADGGRADVWDTNESRQHHTPAAGDDIVRIEVSTTAREALALAAEPFDVPGAVFAVAAAAICAAALLLGAGRISARAFVLAVIVAASALLRSNHLTQPLVDAFSWRQASTASIAETFYRRDANIFFPEVGWTGPGPSYQGRELQTITWMAAALYRLWGQNETIGRALAVAFGVWGVLALHGLVRRVWDEERALVSAAVLAVLPGAVFVDRSFLPDPAMVALVTTSFWLLVAHLQTDRRAYLIGAVVVGAWGFATKLPGLAVALPMAYATVTILRRRGALAAPRLLRSSAAAACGLVPVAGYYAWARHLALSYPPYHFAGAGNWLWDAGVRAWLTERWFLLQLYDHVTGWLWTIPVLVLVVLGFALGLAHAPATGGVRDGACARAAIGGAPYTFHVWLIACATYYLLGAEELVKNPWNLHLVNPAAAALAAHGIVATAQASAKFVSAGLARVATVVATGSVAIFLAVSGQAALRWKYHPYAATDRALGSALAAMAAPGDLVVTLGTDVGDPTSVYYSGRRGWVYPPARGDAGWGALPDTDAEAIAALESLRSEGARWFGVTAARRRLLWEKRPVIGAFVDAAYERHAESSAWIVFRMPDPRR